MGKNRRSTKHDGRRRSSSSASPPPRRRREEREHESVLSEEEQHKEEKKKEMLSLVRRLRLAEEVMSPTVGSRQRHERRVGSTKHGEDEEDTSNTFLLNDGSSSKLALPHNSSSMLALYDTKLTRSSNKKAKKQFDDDSDDCEEEDEEEEDERFEDSYSEDEEDEDEEALIRRRKKSKRRRRETSTRVSDEPDLCLHKKRYQGIAWLSVLALGYLFTTLGIMEALETNKEEAMERHADRVDPSTSASSTTSILVGQNTSDESIFPASRVTVGLYIDHINDISIAEGGWTAGFYLWFRWSATTTTTTNPTTVAEPIHVLINSNETNSLLMGRVNQNSSNNQGEPQGGGGSSDAAEVVNRDHGESLLNGKDPGGSFQFLGSELLEKEWLEHKQQQVSTNNTSTTSMYYDLYRVKVRVTKLFDVTRFPLDNHFLTLVMEDKIHDSNELIYVIDQKESAISSLIQIPGYEITAPGLRKGLKWYAYENARGDPFVAATEQQQINHSQLVIGIPIGRPDWGLYWMMFQGIFASVAASFLGLIVLQNEYRYILSIGALVACVVSTVVSTTHAPMVGVFSLTNYINGVSLASILLTIAHAFLSKHIFQEPPKRWFENLGLAIFVAGYIGCIVGISQTASL